MELKRNYLKIQEIEQIINNIDKIYTETIKDEGIDIGMYGREMIKVLMVYHYCVSDKYDILNHTVGEYTEFYNEIVATTDFVDEDIYDIKNIDLLNECLRDKYGMVGTVREFLEGINEKIDNGLENFDSNSIIQKIAELENK